MTAALFALAQTPDLIGCALIALATGTTVAWTVTHPTKKAGQKR